MARSVIALSFFNCGSMSLFRSQLTFFGARFRSGSCVGSLWTIAALPTCDNGLEAGAERAVARILEHYSLDTSGHDCWRGAAVANHLLLAMASSAAAGLAMCHLIFHIGHLRLRDFQALQALGLWRIIAEAENWTIGVRGFVAPARRSQGEREMGIPPSGWTAVVGAHGTVMRYVPLPPRARAHL